MKGSWGSKPWLQYISRNNHWTAPKNIFPFLELGPPHYEIIWVFPKSNLTPWGATWQQVQSRLFGCQALWKLTSCRRWQSRHYNGNSGTTFKRYKSIHRKILTFCRNMQMYSLLNINLRIKLVLWAFRVAERIQSVTHLLLFRGHTLKYGCLKLSTHNKEGTYKKWAHRIISLLWLNGT